jgi:hypothetical protein
MQQLMLIGFNQHGVCLGTKKRAGCYNFRLVASSEMFLFVYCAFILFLPSLCQ